MTTPFLRWTRTFLFLYAVGVMLFGGCSHDLPEMIPVRGRVTLAGGEWPKPGYVDFAPIQVAPGLPLKPGSGRFDTDGAFIVKSGEYEGLVPGTYRIGVVCWEKQPAHGNPGKGYIPEKFSHPAKSGLTLEIKPGQSDPVIWNHDFPRK